MTTLPKSKKGRADFFKKLVGGMDKPKKNVSWFKSGKRVPGPIKKIPRKDTIPTIEPPKKAPAFLSGEGKSNQDKEFLAKMIKKLTNDTGVMSKDFSFNKSWTMKELKFLANNNSSRNRPYGKLKKAELIDYLNEDMKYFIASCPIRSLKARMGKTNKRVKKIKTKIFTKEAKAKEAKAKAEVEKEAEHEAKYGRIDDDAKETKKQKEAREKREAKAKAKEAKAKEAREKRKAKEEAKWAREEAREKARRERMEGLIERRQGEFMDVAHNEAAELGYADSDADVDDYENYVESRLEDFDEWYEAKYGRVPKWYREGSGKATTDNIDWDNVKWGTFTEQFKRYNSSHKSNPMKNLHQFATMIKKNAKKYTKRTLQRANFYLNVLYKGRKLKGGNGSDDPTAGDGGNSDDTDDDAEPEPEPFIFATPPRTPRAVPASYTPPRLRRGAEGASASAGEGGVEADIEEAEAAFHFGLPAGGRWTHQIFRRHNQTNPPQPPLAYEATTSATNPASFVAVAAHTEAEAETKEESDSDDEAEFKTE